jgi:hypothetical protein
MFCERGGDQTENVYKEQVLLLLLLLLPPLLFLLLLIIILLRTGIAQSV